MVSPAVPPVLQPQPPATHQYGTRIRSNSVIRPSARLRQSPDMPAPPRRIKPVPAPKVKPAANPLESDLPIFPPAHIMLHSDDSSSKVFIAIGRSFMSVDNRAMTIKDLAEMTMKFGLMCQNVSAAGQAITTYIRNHLQRCEVQQDHPLLLRHVLSGTASDDELVPALHSRVGGAHCMLSPGDTRITNFRRGTMVWYLSKAAGAPCPFARVGIQLSEYTENGKVGSAPTHGRDRKRERDQETPKVKLTLKLRPRLVSPSSATGSAPSVPPSDASQGREVIDLSRDSDSDSDSESDSMSVVASPFPSPSPAPSLDEEVLPPGTTLLGAYPRRSISIPCYTPSLDGPYPTFPSHQSYADRRSPSVPLSITSASPPPDSEDEDEDFHISMASARRASRRSVARDDDDDDDMPWDGDLLADFDAETEASPGPRSPSAQFEDEVTVKQEPSDVRGFLDAWDNLESSAADMKVVDVVAQAAAGLHMDPFRPKVEDLDMWDWDSFGSTSIDHFGTGPDSADSVLIKQEDEDFGVPFFADGLRTPPVECASPVSPVTPISPSLSPAQHSYVDDRRPSQLQWRDVELLGPDSVQPHDFDEGSWQPYSRSDATSVAVTSSPHLVATTSTHGCGPIPSVLSLTATAETQRVPSLPEVFSPSLITSLTSLSLLPPTLPEVPKSDPLSHVSSCGASSVAEGSQVELSHEDDTAIVRPCEPCTPDITARECEGVSDCRIWVYCTFVGFTRFVRRVDSDFVNVSVIMKVLGLPYPRSPHAVVVSGSPDVQGTWLPLAEARDIVKGHAELVLFLSDDLYERFPTRLHPCRQADAPAQTADQFGAQFRSTLHSSRRSPSAQQLDLPPRETGALWERGMLSHLDVEDHIFSVHPAYARESAVFPSHLPEDVAEAPLSPSEEEMFDSLCAVPDWEEAAAAVEDAEESLDSVGPAASATKDTACRDRPLRRSKRVANAIATRSRTRSSKRGSRSSLS
ncbi:hypothetical protein B0H21DRAFT_776017 [Amylocystis lapponica]|nr:hypothetical protein B0H21DRAFT_776017 [Amylocystis lapponica]